ncbi:hypothetical protein Tco_0762239 [Tanacetum coccineum]
MVLEETHKSKQAMASANAAATTLVTTPTTPDVSKAPVSTSQSNTNNRNNTNCGRDSGSNNNRGRGRGRGRGSGGDTTSTRQRQPFNASLYQPWGPHPRPQQAYAASTTLTDLEQAMHTMNLQVPEQNWYNLTLWRPSRTAYLKVFIAYFNLSSPKNITVGSEHKIPIRVIGYAHLPHSYSYLILYNVLCAPNLIKNLISLRRFLVDNNISIEFDPFGF